MPAATTEKKELDLPGFRGKRIVCVANLRPQKDHLNLLRAMKRVLRNVPDAHLILVGSAPDPEWLTTIQRTICETGLIRSVTWLGERNDVDSILAGCDVGVLSSACEGLPLALIEYGMKGLPAVATDVGQCAEVLGNGRAGLLVPPNDPDALGDAILELLESPQKRAEVAAMFSSRANRCYGGEAILEQIRRIYKTVLEDASGGKSS